MKPRMNAVNSPVVKKDSMQLLTGAPVYAADIAPAGCLVVKILRSPHAHAWIEEIDTAEALAIPGVACVLTHHDAAKKRFTLAGQTVPQMSALDRLILDPHLRCVGDPVAIIGAETAEQAEAAMKAVKVKYKLLPAVLDFHTAKDNPTVIHPEEDWVALIPLGADNKRNLCASVEEGEGDADAVFEQCAYKVDRTYNTKANQQAFMEPFTTWCEMDTYGRLKVVSSTQIPFHVRRIVGSALDIPASKVRVIKPRVGGGFGAKQSSISEIYPAMVTWKTGRPSMLVFTREECMTNGSPRHQMELRVRVGADENGRIRMISINTLSSAGAYSTHSSAVAGLSGHKVIPLYNKLDAWKFTYDVVYTNLQDAGAYRGFGATQGLYAAESAIDELAHQMGMDPMALREQNLLKQGEPVRGYDGNLTAMPSCTLDKCLARVKDMIGWKENYPRRVMPDGKIRGYGCAVAMQGSSIAGIDVGGAAIRLNEDGSYTLSLGCADMGTGCDTILSQMAADCLDTDMDNIVVYSVDTDSSPYDSGSYASSTTYASGNAVMKACEELRRRMVKKAAEYLKADPADVEFDGRAFMAGDQTMTLTDFATEVCGCTGADLSVSLTYCSPISPPPFMAGAAEIEADPETGKVRVLRYVGALDCGTPINPNLVRVQAEGGILQAIGMALYEDVTYNDRGVVEQRNFMEYKIPSRMDVGEVEVVFESSYEESGPFGAKSVGELVIDTPCPAISNAIENALGIRVRELPITPEKVWRALQEKNSK